MLMAIIFRNVKRTKAVKTMIRSIVENSNLKPNKGYKVKKFENKIMGTILSLSTIEKEEIK